MRISPRSRDVIRIFAVTALAGLAPTAGRATSYLITTFADDAVVNGNCTLREAIRSADTNVAHDTCAAGTASDVITLPTGTYLFSGGETVTGGGSITIESQALNPFNVSIDLGNAGRFVWFSGSGSYVLGGLEIKNGLAPGAEQVGGAVRADGVSLHIFSFRFLSNVASAEGGALFYYSTQAGTSLAVNNGAFLTNSVTGSATNFAIGGAADVSVGGGATVSLRDVSFIGNSATSSSFPVVGGALALESDAGTSPAICVRCSFQNNSVVSTSGSGSNYVEGGAFDAKATSGGRVELDDSRFSGNSATGSATAEKSPVLLAEAYSGGSILMDRLFVDFNGGVEDAFTKDLHLTVFDSASTISLFDSQVTFGVAAGLAIQSSGVVLLGHLTIADYPLIGASLNSTAGQISLQNSIAAFNGTDLGTSGNVVQTTNFVGGNPIFLNEPGGDYHLSAASAAIGQGTNGASSMRFADLDHHARKVGAVTDMGCYEFDGLFADNFEVGDAGSWSVIVP